MSDVAANRVLFPVQGGTWTGYSQSTRDFSKEQYVLPEDDTRYAIETCKSILSVLVKIILD